MPPLPRKLSGVAILVALTACDDGVKVKCTSDCVTVHGQGAMISGSGTSRAETREVAPFSAIRLSDVDARVVIEQTGAESLEVTADDNLVSLFTSEVRDGTLFLSVAKDRSVSGKRPLYRITVKELSQLGIAGAGQVNATGLDGNALAMSVAGSGAIVAAGRVEDVTISISGSGSCDAAGLRAVRAKAAVRGSGELTVNASDELEAIVSGSGTIWYLGAPKLTSSVSGSGSIKAK